MGKIAYRLLGSLLAVAGFMVAPTVAEAAQAVCPAYAMSARNITVSPYTISLADQCALLVVKASNATITVPAPGSQVDLSVGYTTWVVNNTLGNITIAGTVNGLVNPVIPQGASLNLYTDSANWYGVNTVSSIGAGTGDVVGPGSAVADNVASYNGGTGKAIKDSGVAVSSLVPGSRTITGAGLLAGGGDLTANRTITFGAINASSLFGNPTGAPAVPGVITLGTNLTFAGTVLNAAGGSASAVGPSGDIQTSLGSGIFGSFTPGANVTALLTTFNSGTLLTALTTKSGTGLAVFNTSPTITSPTLVTPALGVVASGTLTGATGLPVGGIASIAANSVVMNATGSGATPTAIAIPTCADSAGNHLNYTVGTWSCGNTGGGAVSLSAATPNIVVTPNPITGTGTIETTIPFNTQAGNSAYTAIAGDNTKMIQRTNTVAQIDVLPQATGSFASGWSTDYTATTVQNTITPVVSTIGGLASFKVGIGQYVGILSNSANYLAALGVPPPPSQGGTTWLRDDMTWTIAGGGTGCTVSGSATQILTDNGSGGCTSNPALTYSSGALNVGTAGSVVGLVGLKNATSGTVTLSPPAGALGTSTVTIPAATDTLVARATTDTLTNKTINCNNNTCTNFPGSSSETIVTASGSTTDLQISPSSSPAFTFSSTGVRLRCAIQPSTNAADLAIQFSEDGGSTWKTSSTYAWASYGMNTVGTITTSFSGTDSGIRFRGGTAFSNTGTSVFTATVFDLPSVAVHRVTGTAVTFNSAPGHNMIEWGGEYNGDTGAVTAVRIIASTGNIASVSYCGVQNL